MLMLGGSMMAGSGLVFAITGNYWILLAAAILGVISPGCVVNIFGIMFYVADSANDDRSGSEIGPFRAVEESTLAQLISPEARTDIFAWYKLWLLF
jgi:hypothetical protein